MNKQKALIAGGVAVLICVVGGTSIYLPFYSDFAKHNHGLNKDDLRSRGGGSKGSMWSNMDKEIKDRRI